MFVSSAISIAIVTVLSVGILDIWQRVIHRMGGLPPTNWAIVGRWLMAVINHHKILNHPLQNMPPHPNELMIGWVFHYFIGFFYVVLYFLLWETFGILTPTWRDGLIFGVLSVVVPWFFFMPAMGAGLMEKNTAPVSCENISTGSTIDFWRFNRITPWLDFKQLNFVVYFNTKSKN